MADEPGAIPNQPNPDNLPSANILGQYVKDMSFENPNAPDIYQGNDQPAIDVQFNIGADKTADNVFEVILKVDITAKTQAQTAFVVELAYAGLFALKNVPEEQVQPFLFVEAPRLLFPFARRILADAVRDGNFPALMLEPIDFASLYMQQQAQMAQGGSDNVDLPTAPTGNA